MIRILLLEDDENVRLPFEKYLKTEGYEVLVAATIHEADQLIQKSPHLSILDWMLPDGQGIDLIKKWRSQGIQIPIILLTARNEIYDKIIGLEIGADDYMTKPFEPRELLARIRARLRQTALSNNPGTLNLLAAAKDKNILAHSGIEMNVTSREVLFNGKELPLKKMEFDLLKVFLENPNKVFTRDELLNQVWGYENFPTSRTVDTHILQLRQKLNEELIETLRGVGYRFKKVG